MARFSYAGHIMASSKKIVLGVCGGIAAYKACELLRLFKKVGHTVQVMMTASAQKFVTSLTFQTLSQRPVLTDLFDLTQEDKIGHIVTADEADLIVIAPATANMLARAAHGLADDVISTVLLATKAPVLFAPSMNVNMWQHPATRDNVQTLKSRGVHFVDPENGDLACGWVGEGRMAEPEKIFAKVESLLNKS